MAKKDCSKRTARTGNQNSLYEKVLDEAEKLDFQTAAGVDGIDDEITILRVKIKAILEKDAENIQLIMEATNLLAKLVKIRYSISKKQEKGLKEKLGNIIKDIAMPLGVVIMSKKL